MNQIIIYRLLTVVPLLLMFLESENAMALGQGKQVSIQDSYSSGFIVAADATSTGTWTITRADLNGEVDSAMQQQHLTRNTETPSQMTNIEARVLQFLVLKKLLLAQAAALQLPDIDKEVNAAIENAKSRGLNHAYTDAELSDVLKQHGLTLDQWKQNLHDQIVMQAVLDKNASFNVEPSEQEIEATYNENKAAFNVAPTVRASRVLILVKESDTPEQKASKKARIDAAHERVTRGEDFSKVATEISEDRSSAPRGGDMGSLAAMLRRWCDIDWDREILTGWAEHWGCSTGALEA